MGIDGSEIKRKRELREQKEQKKTESTQQTEPSLIPGQDVSIPKNNRRRRFGISIASAILILIILYIWLGPVISLNAIIHAAADKDSERLKELVDFPLMRENLKEQLNAQVTKSLMKDMQDNPFAAMLSGMAGTISDRIIDSIVTPAGLLGLARIDKDEKAKNCNIATIYSRVSYSFDSSSRSTVSLKDQGEKSAKLMFVRNGINWRLVNIIIPDPSQVFSIDSEDKPTDKNVEANEISATPVVASSAAVATDVTDTKDEQYEDPQIYSGKNREQIEASCRAKWGASNEKVDKCIAINVKMRKAELQAYVETLNKDMARREIEGKNRLYKMVEDAENNCRQSHPISSREYNECMNGIATQRADLDAKYK